MSSILKVNISKRENFFKEADYISPGILTDIDYSNLHSLTKFSVGNIKEINVTGASKTELKDDFDNIENKISDCSKHIEHLSETFTYTLPDYCGRVWDESNSTPTAKTYCGNLNMLQHLPDILGLGGYLVQNDHSRKKLSSANHYKFPDGSPAKLDGSMGHYQWGWDKPFYITTWTEGNLFYECVSLSPIPGKESYYVPIGSMSAAGFATLDRESNTLVSYINNSPRYRGGDNDSLYDNDSLKTLLDRPVTNLTTEEFATAARKNGKGWYAYSVRMNAVVQVLFHIIMGTRNSQADFDSVKNTNGLYSCGLGFGLTTIYESPSILAPYIQKNPFLSMSEYIELGDYIGHEPITINFKDSSNQIVTKHTQIPVFFGLKHPFGYLWRVSEDEFAISNENVDSLHYIRKSLYDNDYEYGTINDSVIHSSNIAYIHRYRYIKELSYNNLDMFPIESTNANDSSSETYYCDFTFKYILYNDEESIYRCGGFNTGGRGGISTISIGLELANKNHDIGSPLCEFTEDFLLEPITI